MANIMRHLCTVEAKEDMSGNLIWSQAKEKVGLNISREGVVGQWQQDIDAAKVLALGVGGEPLSLP
eukprot:scaffold187460_cov36-Cyclotella_meneghiniana.AAC.2